jgi:RNase H-fold protein (predicted Holliday junction resolvase)
MNRDKSESDRCNEAMHSNEAMEEGQRLRRLQFMMNLVMQVIAQDPRLTVDEASQMVADSRTAALAMFPGKELAYDLLYRPRFQRLMRERFRLQ